MACGPPAASRCQVRPLSLEWTIAHSQSAALNQIDPCFVTAIPVSPVKKPVSELHATRAAFALTGAPPARCVTVGVPGEQRPGPAACDGRPTRLIASSAVAVSRTGVG